MLGEVIAVAVIVGAFGIVVWRIVAARTGRKPISACDSCSAGKDCPVHGQTEQLSGSMEYKELQLAQGVVTTDRADAQIPACCQQKGEKDGKTHSGQ
ncbi:MAG: hypothetical protein LBI64_07990 [Coriobacteriales bacterium]|nr:hypothetical protein [Coriobacteriales bacterium]